MSEHTPFQYSLSEGAGTIRYIQDPTSSPCFRSVTRIWHFSSGDVLLELANRRDCLLPDIDHVDVPASDTHQVAGAVALDTDSTVRVAIEQNDRIITKFDRKIQL